MFLVLNNQPKNKNSNSVNNNPNYKDSILTANKEEVRDKAKKGLLSENTSDKVDLENGTNTEEAIMKFAKATEEQRKKALEEWLKNCAENVSNALKNSNITSGTSQTENPQTPATNTDGPSQTEKTQTDKTYEAVGGTTPLWSEEDKKDPIYERYNKQSDEFKSIVMSGYLKNKDKVASFKDYVSSVFKNKDALGEGIKNAGNYNKPTNPTVPPILDAGAKIKQLETQLASMQESYEKLQAQGIEPKELKEQIDKAQAELDKLRDSVANAPAEENEIPADKTQTDKIGVEARIKQLETQLAGKQEYYDKLQARGIEPKWLKTQIDRIQAELDKLRDAVANPSKLEEIADTVALDGDWTYGDGGWTNVDGNTQSEKPQTPATNAVPDVLREFLLPFEITNAFYSEEGRKDPVIERFNNLPEEIQRSILSGYTRLHDKSSVELSFFKDYVLKAIDAKIKQLETELASKQEAYEKLQAQGIEPQGLKEQIDKAQAELDKLRDSAANAPQPQDTAKPLAGGTSQTENPQTPVINITDTSLLEKTQTPETNTAGTSQTEKTQTPDINTDGFELLGGKDVSEQLENKKKMEETIKSELFNFNKPSKIKQLEIQLASMQESYEKLQAKGIEPKGLKEQIDKVQAELDKLRAKNN